MFFDLGVWPAVTLVSFNMLTRIEYSTEVLFFKWITIHYSIILVAFRLLLRSVDTRFFRIWRMDQMQKTSMVSVHFSVLTLLNSGFARSVFYRFPTVIAMGPSGYSTVSFAVVALLEYFSWQTASIICDTRSQNLYDTFATVVLCGSIHERTDHNSALRLFFINIDSSKSDNLQRPLTDAVLQSSGTLRLISVGLANKMWIAVVLIIASQPITSRILVSVGSRKLHSFSSTNCRSWQHQVAWRMGRLYDCDRKSYL